MTKLFIFPCNGNAMEALDCIGGDFELIGFVDDDSEKQGKKQFGFTIFSRQVIAKYPEAKILAVPGNPSSYMRRKDLIESLGINAERFVRLIHPSASVSPAAQIGHNVLIMAGVVITGNAKIGKHVCILPNSVIHHDVEVEDYTLIGSNVTIAGYTKIGKNCYVGSGSSIINNIEVGDNTLVGLGTNVIHSFPPNSKIVGNPARQI